MPFSFDKNEIKKSVRVILEKKTGIKSEIKENFSRVADSFYPMLYTELFKENYSGKESFSIVYSLYLIDDLKSSYEEVTGDVEVMSNSFIYIKKFD